LLEQIRRLGAVALIGDATDLNVLGKARIHRAKYLITVCADDGTNAEIALKACDRVSVLIPTGC
jgi:voltage-gated potassium channel Kch